MGLFPRITVALSFIFAILAMASPMASALAIIDDTESSINKAALLPRTDLFLLPFVMFTPGRYAFEVLVDGFQHNTSNLSCVDLNTGFTLSGCQEYVTNRVLQKGFNRDFCCAIETTACMREPDLLGDKDFVLPSDTGALIDIARCQKKINGKCPVWPAATNGTSLSAMVVTDSTSFVLCGRPYSMVTCWNT